MDSSGDTLTRYYNGTHARASTGGRAFARSVHEYGDYVYYYYPDSSYYYTSSGVRCEPRSELDRATNETVIYYDCYSRGYPYYDDWYWYSGGWGIFLWVTLGVLLVCCVFSGYRNVYGKDGEYTSFF